mmetsp:Transcript_15825/g.30915  ORF Transcript_15825/g.30915 Transcript_15825/m.30915 type:complete len:391 (-) Transcript_15825:122-1294(-)
MALRRAAWANAKHLRGAGWDGDEPSELKELTVARRTVAGKQRTLEANRCMCCWLCREMCVCRQVQPAKLSARCPRVLILVHYKEYGSASNTAKLLPLIAPAAARIALYPEHISELKQLAEANSPALLLWPSADAVPVASIRNWLEEQKQPVTLVVLDGTWSKAKSMAKHIPTCAIRVQCNDEIHGASLFVSRKQVGPRRVSTVEAVAYALEALGESGVVQAAEAALKLNVDAERMQGGNDPYFNSGIRPDLESAVQGAAALTLGRIQKPSSCPLCAAAASTETEDAPKQLFDSAGDASIGGGANTRTPEARKGSRLGQVGEASNAGRATFKNLRVRPQGGRADLCIRTWRCTACKGVFEQSESSQHRDETAKLAQEETLVVEQRAVPAIN